MDNSNDHCKRKRDDCAMSNGGVALHSIERNGHAENVASQDHQSTTASAAALLQSLLNHTNNGDMGQQQQQAAPLQTMPPRAEPTTSSNQDQIQNLLSLLGSSTNQFQTQQANNPPAAANNKIPGPQQVLPQQKSTGADTNVPLNYEIAALLASLNSPNTATASQQQFYNTAPNPPPQAQKPANPTQDEGLQKAFQTILQSMNAPSQQTFPTNTTQSFGGGPFHMMSQHQSHTETQTSSNQFVQPGCQMDNGNAFFQGMFPSTVQQTTNTSNLDVFRLLLLTSPPPTQPQQQQQAPPASFNNTALSNLLLQSLGLTVPAPAPVAPTVDPNLLNMLLGQIAMNPSMLNGGAPNSSYVPPLSHKASYCKSDGQGDEKEADDSSADTCELAGVAPIPMSTENDEQHVSKYQCLVRKQIQFFEATEGDVASTAQGRNKPIVLGQVGIQCCHCVKVSPKLRARGAVYFPSKFSGIYQAAQNMASAHFALCSETSESVKEQLTQLKEGKSTAGGGKKFWGESAADMGVTEDRHGLRFKKLQSQSWSASESSTPAEDCPGYCPSGAVQTQV